jgi:hypothetical protein
VFPIQANASGRRSYEKRTKMIADQHRLRRANPVWYECSSWLGTWATDDRVTWRTTDDTWLAQLERSANGRHVSLAFYKRGTYVGRHDDSGFHLPSRERRNRRPRPAMQSLPLPLAG